MHTVTISHEGLLRFGFSTVKQGVNPMAKIEKGNCPQSKPKGRINDEGKLVYVGPIRIVNQQDLKHYDVTWEDCVHLPIGGVEIMDVHMWSSKPQN